MSLRRATDADRPAIVSFLRERLATSMFPLGNLETHGMEGDHPHVTRFWLQDGARIRHES